MHAVSLRIARCLNGRVSVLLLLAVAFATAAVWRNQESRAQERDARQASNALADATTAVVITPLAGMVDKASVEPGDAVEKGQVLYELSNPDLVSELSTPTPHLLWAEANLKAQIERTIARKEADLKDDVNLAKNLVKAQQQMQILRQRKEVLEQLMGLLTIRSPIDGFVVAPRGPLENQVIKAGSLIAIVTKEKPDEKAREKLREMLDVKDVKVTTIKKGQSLDP